MRSIRLEHRRPTACANSWSAPAARHLYPTWNPFHRSRERLARHGVLRLTLEDGTYSWQFIDTSGRVLDSGEASCRP